MGLGCIGSCRETTEEGFEQYVSEHWVARILHVQDGSSHGTFRRKYLSREEACNALGVDARILDSLVSEGKIAAKVNGTGQSRSFLVEEATIGMELCGQVSLEGFRYLG